MKQAIFVLLLLISLFSYSQNNRSTKSIDSLNKYVKSNFEIIDIQINEDTLLLISTNQSLFFPFGVYYKIDDFINYFNVQFTKKIVDKDENSTVYSLYGVQDTLIVIQLKENDNKIHLVSANIYSEKLIQTDNIHIGISKKEFLSKYFDYYDDVIDNIKVIEMISGLEGAWNSYIFKSNTLNHIIYKTDFQISNQ